MANWLLVALIAAMVPTLIGCGEDPDPPSNGGVRVSSADPGPIHVHGLGVNPADQALYIATHTGMFRLDPAETEASRVGDSNQDTMGFTVVGPDRFLGSGHPGGTEGLPPFLGLIESRDAGKSWEPVSLLGKSDFHVLEAAGERVYGFGTDWRTREPQLLVSVNGGETWEQRDFPEPFISLALDPSDAARMVASGESSLYESSDAGDSWRPLSSEVGLLAWRSPEELVMVGPDGAVQASSDAEEWHEVGHVGGQPAAFEAEKDGLYVALHDGTIQYSGDGGATWEVRSQP